MESAHVEISPRSENYPNPKPLPQQPLSEIQNSSEESEMKDIVQKMAVMPPLEHQAGGWFHKEFMRVSE